MSRILGIFNRTGDPDVDDLIDSMQARSGANADWAWRCQRVSPAALGWMGARQPNLFVGENICVVCDGWVYNREGDESAAEWFARWYRKEGFESALRRANGDFSVAVYDEDSGTLWLGRDRFGVRPLYFAQTNTGFVFASRPRPLFSLPGLSTDWNRRFVALFAASHYRTFDNVPEESPYKDVRQLPAAHWLKVTRTDTTQGKYWALEDQDDFSETESALAERYRELMFDSVDKRLKVCKRPVFTLSGGMDSSSVLASAVHSSGSKQQAFSTVYSDATYDETDEIRSMLDSAVETWHSVKIDLPDVLAQVAQMIDLHDEPVATATWLSHHVMCREMQRHGFDAVFGGLGGDELNAGEYEHFFPFFADLKASGDERQLEVETRQWIAHHDHPIFKKSNSVRDDAIRRLVDLSVPGRCLPDRARLLRYSDALDPAFFDLDAYAPIMEHPFRSYLKNRTYQDMTRETIPCCLRAEDRQTVACGLDNIVPFFDHRLVEFMFRVPGHLKFREGVTKILLREAMKGVLPEETRTRITKTGWNAPAHQWFSGKGRDMLMDLVGSQAFRERGIYNLSRVNAIIDEHDSIVSSGVSKDNHMMFLWQLVNLELWILHIEQNFQFQRRED
jgi:asparagine synthase (glutamine-hydrolysing)